MIVFRDVISTDREIRVMTTHDACRAAPLSVHTANFKFNHHSNVAPSYYRIMARLSKRKQSIWKVTGDERGRQSQRKVGELRRWESSEVEDDFTALGMLQRSADREGRLSI